MRHKRACLSMVRMALAGLGQRAFSALMKRIGAPEKVRDRFPGGYHDLIHDRNKPEALRDIAGWMEGEL